MSLANGHHAKSRLPNAADIPLLFVTTCTAPHIEPVVSHWLPSPEHL